MSTHVGRRTSILDIYFPDAVDCLPSHACDEDTIEDQVEEMIQQHEQSYEQQLLLSGADRVTCDDQLSGSGAATTTSVLISKASLEH